MLSRGVFDPRLILLSLFWPVLLHGQQENVADVDDAWIGEAVRPGDLVHSSSPVYGQPVDPVPGFDDVR